MCVIIVCPPGKDPGVDMLCDAMWDNEDGSGFAIRHDGTITVVRSHDDMQHVLDEWQRLRAKYPTAWAVWHSRLATHGGINMDNVHPFNVPNRPWILAHNGIMPLNDGPLPDRDRSDSRILAEDHVSHMTWGTIQARQGEFETWLRGDKVVIMSERREKGGPVIILNESKGYWDKDGCWYSTTIYGGGCKKCGHGWKRCDCPYVKSNGLKVYNRSTDGSWTTWDDDLDGIDPGGTVTSIVNGVTVTTNAREHDATCAQVRRAQMSTGAYTGAEWDDIGEDDAWEEYLTLKYGADIHSMTDAEYQALEAAELAEHSQGNILDAILADESS